MDKFEEMALRIADETDDSFNMIRQNTYTAVKEWRIEYARRLRSELAQRGEPRVDSDLDAGWLPFPSKLHPDTRELVLRFAFRLAIKLRKAEQKYGYSNGWKESGWMDECRAKLREHVEKGDPLDVAAYCAFLHWHGASTANTHPQPEQAARSDLDWPVEQSHQHKCDKCGRTYLGHEKSYSCFQCYREQAAPRQDDASQDSVVVPVESAEEVINTAVGRFLCWRLPEHFTPDGGISFAKTYNTYIDGKLVKDAPRKPQDWPVGTNLLDADQARQMFEHCLEGVTMSKLAHSNQETMDQIEVDRIKREGCCEHSSDCAVHNGPAYPNGPCDCYAELLYRLDVWATDASTPFPHNEVIAEAASAIRAMISARPHAAAGEQSAAGQDGNNRGNAQAGEADKSASDPVPAAPDVQRDDEAKMQALMMKPVDAWTGPDVALLTSLAYEALNARAAMQGGKQS